MKAHFNMMARYNAWANTRLYKIVRELPDESYRRDVGAYFTSLHGTLNHLLTTDRIWMRRLTETGDHPDTLNAIIYDSFDALLTARTIEDQRILNFVESLQEVDLQKAWDYKTLNGSPQRQNIQDILAHLFNHQTHHRGQAHTILTQVGVKEPEPFDLLIMQRQEATK